MRNKLRDFALAALFAVGSVAALPACVAGHRMKIDPIEIKPIHMTVDVHVKTDRDVDSTSPAGSPRH